MASYQLDRYCTLIPIETDVQQRFCQPGLEEGFEMRESGFEVPKKKKGKIGGALPLCHSRFGPA
jgi:hypothetical protein